METMAVVEVMAELVPQDGDVLARNRGPQALVKAQAIRGTVVPHLEASPAYAPLWRQFQADPAAMAPALDGILQVILAADAALARRLDALLAEYRQAAGPSSVRTIDTDGGAYVGGRVDTGGGTFVGRDQIVHGDQVRGDKVMGDKVGGSKISIGDVSGGSLAFGPGAEASATQGVSGEDLVRLFADVYRQIEARPEDPHVDREEVAETVKKIEQEAQKGEGADPKKIERWLRFLAGMAGDVFDVTVACLTHPAAGIAEVVRKVAQRAKEEAAGS